MHNDAIDTLLDAMPELWKGRRPNGARHTLPSGHTRLDERLPGGGWPIGALTEIITARPGLGELSLLLPALAQLGADGQWVMLVDPPWIPYPPALRARGLALEHAMAREHGHAQRRVAGRDVRAGSGRRLHVGGSA